MEDRETKYIQGILTDYATFCLGRQYNTIRSLQMLSTLRHKAVRYIAYIVGCLALIALSIALHVLEYMGVWYPVLTTLAMCPFIILCIGTLRNIRADISIHEQTLDSLNDPRNIAIDIYYIMDKITTEEE